jgi:hypothetical protein
MEKKKVTVDELAEILYLAVSMFLTKKEVRKFAKETIGYKLKEDILYPELVALHMWIICDTFEIKFNSSPEIKKCLAKFHRHVFDNFIKSEKNKDLLEWMRWIDNRYTIFDSALETEHPRGYLWVLSKKFTENLFGEVKMDLGLILRLSAYIPAYRKYLADAFENVELVKDNSK